MRGWLGNTFGGRLAFYALGVVALLVIGATSVFAVGLLGAEDGRVDRAVSPTVAQTQAPDETGPTQAEKDAEKKKAEEEAKKKAEEAEKKAEERAAAEQAAAEQAAAEQAAAEQAAAEQAAAEQAAAEQAAAEQAAAEQAAAEQAAAEQAAAAEEPAVDTVAPPDPSMLSLTVPKMGRYDDMVMNDMSEATLDQGAGKLPGSGYPWQPGANTYIAAHVLGWEGTNSWLQFANLPNMTYGDMIYLTGSDGTVYTYEVTEIMTVTPYDTWVADPVAGRDMVSLQTCVGANYEWRLIVRGDRVA